jgi:hypothetical protein
MHAKTAHVFLFVTPSSLPLFELLGPPIDFALGQFLGVAVTLLKNAEQFGAFAVDDLDIIMRQLAPLRPDLAFELRPVSFDFIPEGLSR